MAIQGILENNHLANTKILPIKCKDIPIIGFIVSIVKKILNSISEAFNFNRAPERGAENSALRPSEGGLSTLSDSTTALGVRSETPPGSYYYFAYGSNMSLKRLEERIGKVIHCGTAWLKNYSFSFNKRGSDGTGKANLVPNSSSAVEGVVYKLSTTQMNQLDHYEGVPKHYTRKTVSILSSNGQSTQSIQATTYVAKKALTSSTPLQPSRIYLNYILAGAKENDLRPRSVQRILDAAQYHE
jgi:gamma-glutamylcyclotransferase